MAAGLAVDRPTSETCIVWPSVAMELETTVVPAAGPMTFVGKPATSPPDLLPDVGSGSATSGGACVMGGRVCTGVAVADGASRPGVGVPPGTGCAVWRVGASRAVADADDGA